jgi:hypothetical protein
MTNSRGPVVVGMDGTGDDDARVAGAVEFGAREALRRRVDLRLVYGHDDLPRWDVACATLERAVARLAAAYPSLAITTAIYPGTAARALIAASVTASLVVHVSDPLVAAVR